MSSVVYVGRIPHGFYEEEMRAYFSQFGDVKKLRISRNKKTGESKHYGFIEFSTPQVAKVVAETMHNYLLEGCLLQCKVLSPEEVHSELFKGANRKFFKVDGAKKALEKHNAPKSADKVRKVTGKLVKKENAKREKLKQLGIAYEFGGYESALKQSELTKQKAALSSGQPKKQKGSAKQANDGTPVKQAKKKEELPKEETTKKQEPQRKPKTLAKEKAVAKQDDTKKKTEKKGAAKDATNPQKTVPKKEVKAQKQAISPPPKAKPAAAKPVAAKAVRTRASATAAKTTATKTAAVKKHTSRK